MASVVLENLSKDYHGFSKPWKRILAGLSFGYFGIDSKFTALQSIDLSVGSGEILGIIGRNGAGKSTLLKLITGVIRKDKGNLIVNGSVRALLELSVGFNPELSGEENVYYNGLVWGYKPAEIKEFTDSIFEFAELKEFRNSPLKNYSSGMAMRLGFSLATAKRPDILIVDEALAVGDASFQQKCLKRIKEFSHLGSCILVVSHDLGLISYFCTRAILLNKGQLLFDGNPKETIEEYMHVLAGATDPSIHFSESIQDIHISLKNSKGLDTRHHFLGDTAVLRIEFKAAKPITDGTIGFHIDSEKGIRIFGTNSHHLGNQSLEIREWERSVVEFQFPIQFSDGKYSLGISIHKGESHLEGSYFWAESILDFEVERGKIEKFVGICHLPTEFSFQTLPKSE
ncbi:ABC transporter ATP-binding protein [Leptospira sp. 2 VSF19]|uniref:ABC transporter ATP-binding protein n=1 Tax=Leptospira soteropolitanensis TaxID=2950025 RepID=A0AAW5VJ88_9LEPT|nr:ABC transporter ATP-binding protein [Leptospira soteropolitanensis]MCW7493944.1 ABC transporter ATP-binding protein [Leptospira soteropolitanensis]MCW7501538.1 ABC transporter ATP-binding protein [Leptospira soteropolitanensis]MCW7523700.1 ABC transporter ATP-binding protein [Leptospira soteropolitanensis]MCW7527563.1 ABC transporter ATP-binding protein [Leptospira soteropolitanensis]MCW7531417.1 ABC transporter ATP-binding protein [Leptospira soteropolitanensis]